MSRERRFHVDELTRETLQLRSEEAHHLIDVLRLGEGAEVSVFDGKGNAARAQVHRIEGRKVELRILGPEPTRESRLALTLAIAPPKGDRMSFLVEKLTELGIASLVPLETDRGRSRGDFERWRRIAIESCKQSGRSRPPAIEPPRSVASIVEERGPVLAAHPGSPPLDVGALDELIALVGPEGGWSDSELSLFASRGVTLFGLGPRTLRTETAAVAVATLFQFLAGDFGE